MQDAGEAYLVDPKFKEQFEIAHPTERYVELLDAVPAFFVGTEHRLVTLVELLCSEMSAAFQTTGTLQPDHLSASACCIGKLVADKRQAACATCILLSCIPTEH